MAQCHRGATATCLPAGAHHRPGYVQATGSPGRTQPAAPPGQRSRARGTLAGGMRSRGGVDWLLTREAPGRRGVTGPGPRTAQSRSARSGGGASCLCPARVIPRPANARRDDAMLPWTTMDHTRAASSPPAGGQRVWVIDASQRRVPHLALSDVEPDTAQGAGHGAERHGHFLAAPPVPFLGKRMGH